MRLDLRRLPLAKQIAAVRKYAHNRVQSAHYDMCADPEFDERDIAKKFHVICPLGLLFAYHRDAGQREARRVIEAERTLFVDLHRAGDWMKPATYIQHQIAKRLATEGRLEMRRIPAERRRCETQRGHEFRLPRESATWPESPAMRALRGGP